MSWEMLEHIENNPQMTDEEMLDLMEDYYRSCRFLAKGVVKLQNERNLFPPQYPFEALPGRDLRALFRKAGERARQTDGAQTNRSTP